MEYLYLVLFAVIIILQIVILIGRRRREKPVLLMNEGRLIIDNMKSCSKTVEDIICAARKAGYFNLADVDTAVLETDGEISILPVASKRRLTPRDFNFNPVREGLSLIVYQNSKINYNNLKAVGFTEEKLAQFLEERGYRLSETELIIISESGRVKVY